MWTEKALRSEIEALELICAAKETELRILRNQLVESHKLLKQARSEMNDENRIPENRRDSHLERLLGTSDPQTMRKRIDKLVATETKYLELVKTVCIRDRVDMTQISHAQLVRSLRNGEPLSTVKDEIHRPSGVAWTFH